MSQYKEVFQEEKRPFPISPLGANTMLSSLQLLEIKAPQQFTSADLLVRPVLCVVHLNKATEHFYTHFEVMHFKKDIDMHFS